MATLYLHLGAHRTGSTSLQRHLRVRREERPEVGVPLRKERHHVVDIRPLVWLSWERASAPPALAAAMVDGSLKADGRSEFVLSEENLLGPMPGRDAGLYPRAAQLAQALGALREAGHQLRALVVLREPVALIESCYHFLAGSAFRGTVAQFLDVLRPESFLWLPVLEPLRAVLGSDLTVLPYELLAREPRAFVAELARFHPLCAGFQARRRVNASAPDAWLAVSLAAEAAGRPLGIREFRRGGRALAKSQSFARVHAGELPVDEAHKLLTDAKLEVPRAILDAGLRRWVAADEPIGKVPKALAAQLRAQLDAEWDAVFDAFMPRFERSLWPVRNA